MFCTICGNRIEGDSHICSRCGATLQASPPPPPTISMPYPGAGKRISAFLVDCLLVVPVTLVFLRLVFRPVYVHWESQFPGASPFSPQTLWTRFTASQKVEALLLCLVGLTLVPWIYEWLMDASRAQATLGKIAVGIVVTDLRGRRISVLRSAGRSALKALCLLTPIPYLAIVNVAMLASIRKRTLHDLGSGCVVTSRKTGSTPK